MRDRQRGIEGEQKRDRETQREIERGREIKESTDENILVGMCNVD